MQQIYGNIRINLEPCLCPSCEGSVQYLVLSLAVPEERSGFKAAETSTIAANCVSLLFGVGQVEYFISACYSENAC